MAVFFAYERLRVLLRVAIPLALGVDMVHSFYYVARLIQEKRSIEAEKERRLTLYTTTALFKRISRDCNETNYSFWPEVVRQTIQTAPLPDMSSLPRPSYELDDDDEEESLPQEPKPSLMVYRLKEWSPSPNPTSPSSPASISPQDTCSEEKAEDEIIAAEEGEEAKEPIFKWDVGGWVEELYNLLVPYPVRHPWKFACAVQTIVGRELRLHLKKSDRYFEARGAWLRAVLHVPYIMFERRSALRFRVRLIPLP